MSTKHLPLFLEGEVVKGFGRGSKDLGCPTANYPLEVVQSLPKDLEPGVYYGWAQIDKSEIYKMVANIGWCPFYQNKQMSVETHVMHKFDGDFYGSHLRVSLVGYLRGEKNFKSLDDLIDAIKLDIDNADAALELPQAQEDIKTLLEYVPVQKRLFYDDMLLEATSAARELDFVNNDSQKKFMNIEII